jgi:hypothetical protein
MTHNLGLPNSKAFKRSKLNKIQYIRFRSRRSHTGSVQFVGSMCKPSRLAVPTACNQHPWGPYATRLTLAIAIST